MGIINKIKTALTLSPSEVLAVLREKRDFSIERRKQLRMSATEYAAETLEQLKQNPIWFRKEKYSAHRLQSILVKSEVQNILKHLDSDEKQDIIRRADQACAHEFDLLGSGLTPLGKYIDWQRDFISGFRWESALSRDITSVDLTNDADIKVPWELSRHQHLVTLAQAFTLTGEPKYAEEFEFQVSDWIEKNPPLVGVNWICAMDVSFRAMSWIYSWALFDDCASLSKTFRATFNRALNYHGEFVANNLEDWGTHRNNHYISNGTGLFFLGLAYRKSEEGKKWLAKGIEILEQCMEEQVLDDGVDYEMSTAYHRLVLECFLYPAAVGQKFNIQFSPNYMDKLGKMLEFEQAIAKPNGDIPLFGDCDDGRSIIFSGGTIAHKNNHSYLLAVGNIVFPRRYRDDASDGIHYFEALWLTGRLPLANEPSLDADSIDLKVFPQGGFAVLRAFHYWAFFDSGPRGIPGARGVHGHNDATSFSLNIGKNEVVVDSGTYTYSRYPDLHLKAKSSFSHNLVIVDGQEIADTPDELWVLGDEAKAEIINSKISDSSVEVTGRHYGYTRFRPEVITTRTLRLSQEECEIVDTLDGEGTHQIELRFHTPLKPEVVNECVVLLSGTQSICTVEGPKGWVPFIEHCDIAVSYGVHRDEGWLFGWRILSQPLPITFSTSIKEVN